MGDNHLVEYAKNITTFLKNKFPDCPIIPTKNNYSNETSSNKGKNPAYPHKNKDSKMLWDMWDDKLRKDGVMAMKKGLLIILRKDLIVIDIDDIDCVSFIESRFPIVKETATQRTSKGKHFFFRRSERCDELKIYDAARKLFDKDGTELPIDIKTVCSTGTGGVISIYPSQNKEWINPLDTSDIITFPDELLDFVIEHHKDFNTKPKNNLKRQDQDSKVYATEQSQLDRVETAYAQDIPLPENVLKDVKTCVSNLSKSRADNRSDWINIGHCLHNIHKSLLGVWIEFSKRSHKFKDGECESLWRNMRQLKGGLHMGSLKFWADQDSNSSVQGLRSPSTEGIQDGSSLVPRHDTTENSSGQLIECERLDPETAKHIESIVDIDCRHQQRLWSKTKDNMVIKLLPCQNKMCLINKKMHDLIDMSYIDLTEHSGHIKCMSCIMTKNLSKQNVKKLCKLFGMNENAGTEAEPTDYEVLRQCLVDVAQEKKYKKLFGYIYRPLDNCPCAYELHKDYEAFINEHLASHALMKKSVRRFEELMKYLTKIDEPEFPFLVKNRNVLSFKNGILLINERKFIEYKDYDVNEGIVARHHIDQKFNNSFDTPKFDAMLRFQFEEDVCKFLYFMIGKMFFKVREKENYSVMPYLYGMGQTGKSTVINIVSHMFQPSEITTISENAEAVFGLQNKWNKEVMLISDCGEHFSKSLDQTLFQKMVSGETINVPQKGMNAIDIKWNVPIMIASNFYLDYKDSSQQISRRVVTFNFKNFIAQPDPNLEANILNEELSNIVWKSINTYLDIIEEAKGKDFWQFCPQYFKDSQLEVRQELNYVTRFLTADSNDNCSKYKRYYVLYKPGHKENMADVKSMFMKYMSFKHPNVRYEWKADYTAFKQMGFKIIDQHMCKSCKKHAIKGCCENYHTSNRSKKTMVENIQLVEEDLAEIQEEEDIVFREERDEERKKETQKNGAHLYM